MFDKYQIIDSIVVQIDKILEQRGITRAATAIEVIQKLNALRKGLEDEETSMRKELQELRNLARAETIPIDKFFDESEKE